MKSTNLSATVFTEKTQEATDATKEAIHKANTAMSEKA